MPTPLKLTNGNILCVHFPLARKASFHFKNSATLSSSRFLTLQGSNEWQLKIISRASLPFRAPKPKNIFINRNPSVRLCLSNAEISANDQLKSENGSSNHETESISSVKNHETEGFSSAKNHETEGISSAKNHETEGTSSAKNHETEGTSSVKNHETEGTSSVKNHETEGSTEKNENHQSQPQESNTLLDKLRRYGLAGILSYGLLNTVYYLVAFIVVWFYIAPAPAKMGYAAATGRFLTIFATVWVGSQVTKLARVAGAVAMAPFVDRGLSWFMVKYNFESQGKAFMAIVGFCLGLALVVAIVVTLLSA